MQLCAASGKKQNNFLLSNWSLLILVSKTAAFAGKHKNEPRDGSKIDSHDQILTFSKNLRLDNQNYSMTAWLAKKSASWSKKLYAGKWWDMNTCAWIFPSLFSCSEQLCLEIWSEEPVWVRWTLQVQVIKGWTLLWSAMIEAKMMISWTKCVKKLSVFTPHKARCIHISKTFTLFQSSVFQIHFHPVNQQFLKACFVPIIKPHSESL